MSSDFDIIEELGKGHFGTAYLVHKKASGELYCMKVLQLPPDDPCAIFLVFLIASLTIDSQRYNCSKHSGSPYLTTFSFSIYCSLL